MTNTLNQSAVLAALNSSWDQAIIYNKKILKEDPRNIDALNRLAYAYFESGNPTKAQFHYRQVLKKDPFNPIALRNLQRIREFSNQKFVPKEKRISPPMSVFLEEPGKTKLVSLVKIAAKSVLSQVRPGDFLYLSPKNHTIAIVDSQKKYLGILPDDLSFRLIKFIKGGNKYEVYVRSVSKNSLLVFLREVFRSSRYNDVPSFLSKTENLPQKTIRSTTVDANEEEQTTDSSSNETIET